MSIVNQAITIFNETTFGINYLLNPIYQLYIERQLIWDLSVRGVMKNYLGSSFGILWLFLEQFIFVFVLWVVFTKGLKFGGHMEVAFLPWFLAGYTLWLFLSKCLNVTPTLFSEYSFLLKRWRFKAFLIPIINMMQFLIIHFIFLIFLLLICLINRIEISFFWVQSLYYLFSTIVLMIGLSLIVSTVSLFVKDIKYFVAIAIQMGFWISPIYWEANNFPASYQFYLRLNPIHYLIQGYRDSFIYSVPFWNRTGEGLYFWVFNILILYVGALVYRKLRPQFGDVL